MAVKQRLKVHIRYIYKIVGLPLGNSEHGFKQLAVSVYVVIYCRLLRVSLDIATEMGEGERMESVEMCACPAGFAGTSCEVDQNQSRLKWSHAFVNAAVSVNTCRHTVSCTNV